MRAGRLRSASIPMLHRRAVRGVAEHLPAGRRFMQRRDWLQLESRLQELPVHRRGSALRIGRWYESFV